MLETDADFHAVRDDQVRRQTPATATAKSLLMEDAVPGNVVSVRTGGINQEALFANPFKAYQQEALIIDASNQLTYLSRSSTSATGWDQKVIANTQGFKEVVTIVHVAADQVWAACVAPDDSLQMFLLGEDQGPDRCSWKLVSNVTPGGIKGWRMLSVSYPPDKGALLGSPYFDATTLRAVMPGNGSPWHYERPGRNTAEALRSDQSDPVVSSTFKMDQCEFGRTTLDTFTGSRHCWSRFYRQGDALWRLFIPPLPLLPCSERIASDCVHLAGLYYLPNGGEVGCAYVTKNGDLVTHNFIGPRDTPNNFVETRTPLGVTSARLWQDAEGMIHVYGLDNTGVLKVLHQSSWLNSRPVWTSATDSSNKRTAVVIGLHAMVINFVVDPFPTYKPSQLIKMAGVHNSEAYCICTQDVTTSWWASDRIRLPGGGDPHLVKRYVSEVVLRDAGGAPIAHYQTTLSAESVIEIEVGGKSYQIGGGQEFSLKTDINGKVAFAVAADSFAIPKIHLDAAGLASGVVIQPAVGVHDYLSGRSSIPSQNGKLTAASLAGARVDGRPLTKTQDMAVLAAVVQHSADAFTLAAGMPLPVRMIEGFAEPQAVVGYVINAADDGTPFYRTFATDEAHAAYMAELRARPDYGGIWDDFVSWAGDVWQGIKRGVVQIAAVVVHKVTSFFIRVGDLIIELKGFLIDCAEKASRAVEAVFQTVVESVSKVVEWLAALFNFKDIWDTKVAIEAAITQMPGLIKSLLDEAVTRIDGHNWFLAREREVKEMVASLRSKAGGQMGVAATGLADGQVFRTRRDGEPLTQSALANPQSAWLIDRVLPAVAASNLPASFTGKTEGPFDTFIRVWETSAAAQDFTLALDGVAMLFKDLIDVDNPQSLMQRELNNVLDILEGLSLGILKTCDALIQALVALIRSTLDAIETMLRTPIPIPYITDLYNWIHKQARPGSAPEPMTAAGIAALLLAFPVTVGYKVAMGVNQAPFPGGKLIPKPSYHKTAEIPDPPFGTIAWMTAWAAGALTYSVLDIYGDDLAAHNENQLLCILNGTFGLWVTLCTLPAFGVDANNKVTCSFDFSGLGPGFAWSQSLIGGAGAALNIISGMRFSTLLRNYMFKTPLKNFPVGAGMSVVLGLAGTVCAIGTSVNYAVDSRLWRVGNVIATLSTPAQIMRIPRMVGTKDPWSMGAWYAKAYLVNPLADIGGPALCMSGLLTHI